MCAACINTRTHQFFCVVSGGVDGSILVVVAVVGTGGGASGVAVGVGWLSDDM